MASQTAPEREPHQQHGPRFFEKTAAAWPRLDLYERFEQIVSLVLSVVIGVVIVVALAHLVLVVARSLFFEFLTPVDHAVFQAIFGMIMTVLIALEFNHTILGILHRRDSIVQVKTVILIALLAISRKFIILDTTSFDPLMLVGLAFAALALGSIYWLVCEQDRRQDADKGLTPHR